MRLKMAHLSVFLRHRERMEEIERDDFGVLYWTKSSHLGIELTGTVQCLMTSGGATCSKLILLLFSFSKYPLQMVLLSIHGTRTPSVSVILKH